MATSDKSKGQTWSQLTLFAADHLASQYPLPGSEKARQMTVGSGLKLCALLKNSTPVGAFSRILLASSAWVSTKRYLTWKIKVTKQQRLLFQLAPWMPRNFDTESGLWPTPRAGDGMTHPLRNPENIKGNGRGRLEDVVALWPTPTSNRRSGLQSHGVNALLGSLNPEFVEWLQGYPITWTELEPWETP